MRRGRPTTHKVHGEAYALLAGDALLTDAMTLLADPEVGPKPSPLSPEQRAQLVRILAGAAGSQGMVRGQALDLYWTAKQGASHADLNAIHVHKTGKLLGAACAMGAVVGGGSPDIVNKFQTFGETIGLAFQIVDDLLDESDATGKSAGKDKRAGKLTYLSHWSRGEAAAEAARLTQSAVFVLEHLPINHSELTQFATALVERSH
jgi:geranylgeranyl pyrophosphate synthase